MLMKNILVVADCVALTCQITQKLERATTVAFTTIRAIIFILCYQLLFFIINIVISFPIAVCKVIS
jgi:hypothetical protein